MGFIVAAAKASDIYSEIQTQFITIAPCVPFAPGALKSAAVVVECASRAPSVTEDDSSPWLDSYPLRVFSSSSPQQPANVAREALRPACRQPVGPP